MSGNNFSINLYMIAKSQDESLMEIKVMDIVIRVFDKWSV